MEGRITLAMQAIQQGSVKSINAASVTYDVTYSTASKDTLHDATHGRQAVNLLKQKKQL
jgi:hypothetical protein